MIITTAVCDICRVPVDMVHHAISVGIKSSTKDIVADPKYAYVNTYGTDLCDSCFHKFKTLVEKWIKQKAIK